MNDPIEHGHHHVINNLPDPGINEIKNFENSETAGNFFKEVVTTLGKTWDDFIDLLNRAAFDTEKEVKRAKKDLKHIRNGDVDKISPQNKERFYDMIKGEIINIANPADVDSYKVPVPYGQGLYLKYDKFQDGRESYIIGFERKF